MYKGYGRFGKHEEIQAYQKSSLRSSIAVADNYTVTKMLYQGLFERLARAKGAIERKDYEVKAVSVTQATKILESLRSTLDFSYNKTLAQNLFDLYTFMIDKVIDASVHLKTESIDAALRVLKPIKEAWDSIPYDKVQEALALQKKEHTFSDLSIAKGAV